MQLRIFNGFLPFRHLFRFPSDHKVRELYINLCVCSIIDCQTVHAHCIQACIERKQLLLFQLCHCCSILLFSQAFCLLLCILCSVIEKNLIIICLLITEHERQPGGTGHHHIKLARIPEGRQSLLFCHRCTVIIHYLVFPFRFKRMLESAPPLSYPAIVSHLLKQFH